MTTSAWRSRGQRAMWFLERLAPEAGAHHIVVSGRVLGTVMEAPLWRALLALVGRHPLLRARFPAEDGEPRLEVSPDAELDFARIEAPSEEEMRRLLAAEAYRPFDLENGPLFRVRLATVPGGASALLVVIHHIVADFWSLAILARELGRLYAQETGGPAADLPPLEGGYGDFARAEEASAAGAEGERSWDYWRKVLAPPLPVLDLATDHPRPPVQTHRGAARVLELDPASVHGLRAFGRRRGATLFATLAAAFQALLHRYSGQRDLLLGTLASGRSSTRWSGTVGYFVNPLVLRADLGGDPSFAAHLARTREAVRGAFEHQGLPFPLLAERLQPVRDPSRPPVFQALFTLIKGGRHEERALAEFWLGRPGARIDLGGFGLEPFDLGEHRAQFELALSAAEGIAGRHGLTLSLEVNADLFDGTTAARLLRHLAALLDSGVAEPDLPLAELPLLAPAERHQILAEWSGPPSAAPATTVDRLFRAQAAATPESVAVVAGVERLTYRELDERAARLASRLRAAGVGPEVRVAVLLRRSAALVAGLLAVHRAGGAYVPLDPSHPEARLDFLLRDSGAAVLLTESALPLLPDAPVRRVLVDAPEEERAEEDLDADSGADPLGLAYVIYTSGSTGRPKGVQVPQGALANFLLSMSREPGLAAGDVLLAVTTLSFDIAGLELLLPLVVGARVEVADREETVDGRRLWQRLERSGANVFQATPATWRMLLDAGWEGDGRLRALCGGEALPADLAARLLPRVGEIWNVYGPTETTVWSAARRVTAAELGEGPTVAVGGAIADTRLVVLDGRAGPAPVGMPGELCIGGAGLARGYLGELGAPELTAERFVPDPFAAEPGERMYRTGDLARWRPDGRIELLGRIDFQVKVRGFRIELGEVEAALAACAGIRQAVAGVRGDRLVAWLVAEGEAPAPAELRRSLAERLPEALVPSVFIPLAALPLTPAGKVDRRSLPDPAAERTESGAEWVAPRTETESLLAEVWCEVLDLPRVGLRDSFFDLGGHSLLATRVVARVRKALGIEIPVRALFEEPTLERLAGLVERASQGRRTDEIPLVPMAREGAAPLSFSQQRFWLLDRLEPGSSAYNLPVALRLAEPLDERAFARALGEVARRHESLRTTFRETADGPVQVVAAAREEHPLPAVDLSGLPGAGGEREALRLADEEARRPFDLERGPLLRATVLRLRGGACQLLLTLHHVACDGWSMRVLSRELAALYAGSPMPSMPIQYADFALWQRRWLQGEAPQARLRAARQRLRDLPPALELPAAHPRGTRQGRGRGAVHSLHISAGLSGRLRELGRREGATPFMTLLAAFQVLLCRYTGQTRLCVGTPVAGRSRLETEGMIGLFLNTLPICADLSGDPPFREALARVRSAWLDAFADQDLPFETVVETLQSGRGPAGAPLFQVMFNLLGPETGGGGAVELFGQEVRPFGVPGLDAKLDLTLYASERADGFDLELDYDASRFDEVQMERMAGHLRTLLAGIAADPDRRLADLPLAGPQRTARRPSPEAEGSVPERFARIAREHAGRLAVATPRHRWTYAELDRLAGRAARGLLAAGLDGGTVALLFEHDAPMVAGLLAGLAVGSTCVPLDPLYPRQRLSFLLADSGADAVLADAANLELARGLAGGSVPVLELAEACAAGDSSAGLRLPDVPAETPAYILYTSGSTGEPKGVLQSQRNLLHHIEAYAGALRIAPEDRLSLLASYSFDAAVMDIFGAVLTGAALFPFSVREEGIHPLADWLAREGITIYHSTPTLYRQLAETLDGGQDLSSVRLVVLGGERAVAADLERFERCFPPGAVFVNGLGPTECTVALQFFAGPAGGNGRATVPVGRPVPGVEVGLVHPAGEQAAVYGVGEIVLRGPYLALGYWRRPDLTAAAFQPDPAADGGRAYRTGDLGRWLPDGSLEFVGRNDGQVKIRGHRVETGEVEGRLSALPGVRQAVVATREGADGEPRLAAWVIPSGEPPVPAELAAGLRRQLPEFMIPGAFVMLDRWPLTPTGKVDRPALPDPAEDRRAAGTGPRNPLEEILCALWAEVLHVHPVGVFDDFFALGGHSLTATRLVARLRRDLGIEMPLRRVFEAPTVAGLAERIETELRGSRGTRGTRGTRGMDGPAPVPADRDGRRPLSSGQQRLWFLDQLQPGGAAYNMVAAIRLAGRLDTAALAGAFHEMARRHESLRTTFVFEGGEPEQVVSPPHLVPVPLAALDGLPEGLRRREADRLARRLAAFPFDLDRGPLLRVALLRLAEDEHVAVVAMHHIVSDGWSLGILAREVAALYEAAVLGRPSPLPELPLQYADFAVWQRRWLGGETLAGDLAWWRERLRGLPPRLALPTDRPRPAVPSQAGGLVPFALPPGLTRDLGRLAAREGSTPFMVLMAAFLTLLGRSSGEEDLAVGTPVAGRTRVETEGLIGLFVNTLVLRGDLSGDPPFRELLRRIRSASLEAHAHQELPFEKLVEELQPERSLDASPLFQVMLTWQNTPREPLALAGLSLELLPVLGTGQVKVDLHLVLSEDGEGISGALEYAAELFDAPTANRLAEHLKVLLIGIATPEGPDRRLSELPLLGAADRHQIVSEWNDTRRAFVGEGTLHGLVAAQAARTPDALAVEGEDGSLTYAELAARANRLARFLRRAGVGPESRVGICLERSPDLVVALLATLQAGGAYVPLDPGYPRERLARMLEDARPAVVLTEARLRSRLPEAACPIVALDEEQTAIGSRSAGSFSSEVDPEGLAYVIFTSGSTGRPKGAMNTHAGIVARLLWAQETYGLGADDRVLQKTPFSFDVSVWELFWPLVAGARLVLARPGGQGDSAYLARRIAERGITTVHFVPSMLRAFLEGADLSSCRTLRRVFASGEALAPDLRDRVLALLPGAELENLYGPTETSIEVTRWSCREPAGRVVPIGRPIANASIHLLDAGFRPVPIGVTGEIFIGGRAVGRGYAGRPDLTAERFVPDPAGRSQGEPGARLYRTGDLARRLPAGEIDFLGRADHQVKLRGVRIELGEVEAALLACPGVREAAAAVRESAAGDARFVAWIAPEGVPAADLAAHLRGRLPEAMVPSVFVPLESLPLTASGKIDRRSLPEPAAATGGDAWEPPRGEVEELLAAVWSELLGADRVGRSDGFFALGGHSLLATRLVSRVRALFGVELPLQEVFAAPRLADLAARTAAFRASGADLDDLPLVPLRWDGRRRPLSSSQERLWFLEQLEPGSSAYVVPLALRLAGALDPAALAGALAALAARHETLRTRFASAGGEVWQEVDAALPELALADLGALAPAAREEEITRVARAEAERGFDLARGPLVRAVLLRLGEADHALLLTLHHAISDAWSLGVLLRELGVLYEAIRGGRPSPLPPLPIQYADYAEWERRRMSGPALAAPLGYFRERLRGLPPELELPFDRPRPETPKRRGAQLPWSVPASTTADLRALGQREGATLFMVLLAAFSAFLGRHAGREDVVVGAPVAHRTRREVEGLIGFFVNTLVLRVDLGGDPSFAGLLARARETALGAYAHQDLPFERLVEELAPERSRSRPPVVQVLLAFQNVPLDAGLPDIVASPLPAADRVAKVDLTLTLTETGGGFSGALEYDPDLFDATTAERLLARFSTLLAGIGARAGQPLSELPCLTEAERHQLFHEWNDSRSAFPRESSLDGELAAQAARTPDATALLWQGGRLTYRELDAAAGRLAARLRAAGVGPEARVGLFAERSPEAIVGTAAILRAGAAYVPLDPAYPEERLALLLSAAGIEVLLAREGNLDRVPPTRAKVVPFSLGSDDGGPALPEMAGGGDRLAYVMYTSGSTGRPKGVAVSHANVLRLVRGAEYVQMGPGEVFLQLTPISFDVATLEIWGPLLSGGCLAIPAPGLLSLAELGDAIVRLGVTALWLTSGLFQRMVEENLEGLAPVRQLLAGGDAVSPVHAGRVLAAFPDCRLIDGYGPTESTTFACCHRITPEDAAGVSVPIGRPIPNTRALVVGRRLEPAPIGVPGELALGGEGLARGYLDDPARTAERFVPDPLSGEPGARLYRTGDQVRQLPDGRLLFLGRLDRQVKIRGFRVEPGEVEAALARHPALADCAVGVRPDPAGDRRLVAWAVPAPGERISAAGLQEFLAGLLPAPLVPAAFVIVPALPLDPNGKVDRRALPDPEEASGPRSGAAETQDPVAELLAGLFADALGRDRVAAGESFFDLGGHSLMAMRLVARVRQALGIELPIADLFAAPTPALLARRVAALADGREPDSPNPPILPGSRTGDLPLSFAQERLWFLDQLAPGNATYNIAQAVEIDGPLDPAALAAALTGVVARHEALRTVFAATPAGPAQQIQPASQTPLPITDLSGLPDAAWTPEVRRLEREEAARPFDLAAGPLLRAALVRRGPGEHRLLLNLHHIVADGWSMGILVREVAALYEAAAEGRPSPLPPPDLQFADFALWQRRQPADADLAYWRGSLAGAPPALDLPTDRPRGSQASGKGEVATLALPEELAGAVAALARREGATPFMVLLTAFEALLARWTGQEDLTVGSPVAGRRRAEIEGVVGPFLNLLVLRARLEDDPAFRSALERTRATALGAYAHQDLPFEKLVEELKPERDLGRSPLFQAMLALQNTPPAPLAIPGLDLRARDIPAGTAKFDWTLWLSGSGGGGMLASLEVAADLFDRATAERVLRQLATLLAGAVAEPGRRLSELPLLPGEERVQLLGWNDTAAPLPEVLVHDLVLSQAERSPAAAALEHAGERLTYGELAERVHRLAHRLRAAGVGPETCVALLFERSVDMVVALLAVLEAGGAYVPLDPGHPMARLRMIVEDSGAALLLTAEGLPAGLADGGPRVLAIETGEGDASRPAPWAAPENLAYVLYTSGSTGRPKGVGVPHRAMVNFLLAMARRPGLAASDRLLAVTTLSFDIAGLELLLPLACGATVVLASREEAADGRLLAAALERSAATVLQATPSTWRLLFDGGWPGDPGLTALCGGEALPPDLAERLAAVTGRLVNLYGPTETTVWSTLAEIRRGDGMPAIGRPIANTRVWLVDRRLAPVPPGAAGELWIGGAGLARGYLGRPDLTAERFVPDPFGGKPGARAYRTGDLARLRSDGELEFLGRLDHQVKVRGFRIELQEVEAALAALPGVRAAAAAVREGVLLAWLVPAGENLPDAATLRRVLGETLPPYMVPTGFVRLEALPLTPNGKVDRLALPAPGARERTGTDFVPPRTQVEEAVALLTGEVLGIERVGVTDDFFDLGGHSLLAARLAARLRESFGVDLPLRSLFRSPTVEAMARELIADPARRQSVEKRARLLLRLARMPEEEAAALLGARMAPVASGGDA